MKSVKGKYERRIQLYQKLFERQTAAANLISNLRLFVFVMGIGFSIYLYFTHNYYLMGAAILTALILFIYLVIKHQKVIENKKYVLVLISINEDSLKRLDSRWKAFDDKGGEFVDTEHRYSYDLDIFGQGSLFQWINSTVTHTGRGKLKDLLANPVKDIDKIRERQHAVGELSCKLSWRQRFLAEGLIISKELRDPEHLCEWAAKSNSFYLKYWVKLLFLLLPVLTVVLIVLAAAPRVLPYYIPAAALVIHFFILKYNAGKRLSTLNTAARYKESIKKYGKMIKVFEEKQFDSQYLRELKNGLLNGEKLSAYRQINRLAKIVDRVSDRYNAFYHIFNLLFLWDYQCIIALEYWKRKSGCFLNKWLETIGEIESLSSLAIIGHDHPSWVMPQIEQQELVFNAMEMGHPLMGDERIYNNLRMGNAEPILLITGSNMSGKSTLLRTAGINLVLAYAGAPVCAGEFRCSIMEIYTCMRISDNLEKNISSFYAEILRVKMIVEACKNGKKVYFLLDEIFKGTNSYDRHTGAKVLINKLSKLDTLGLVSTHDLELGSLEEESGGRIKNYHFQEYYKNNKIYFDYKLKQGISMTRNAAYLMKMAGIEFKE